MAALVAPHTGAWIETSHSLSFWAWVIVAPHTGAWIETLQIFDPLKCGLSHPTRVRGLKLTIASALRVVVCVAPHTGAWIETPRTAPFGSRGWVAPHTGAWIET